MDYDYEPRKKRRPKSRGGHSRQTHQAHSSSQELKSEPPPRTTPARRRGNAGAHPASHPPRTKQQERQFSLNTALLDACRTKKLDEVKSLLEQGAQVNAQIRTWFPLLIAAKDGNVPLAAVLLQHGADVNMTNKPGLPALLYAARRGRKEMIRLLLQHGADPHVKKSGMGLVNVAKNKIVARFVKDADRRMVREAFCYGFHPRSGSALRGFVADPLFDSRLVSLLFSYLEANSTFQVGSEREEEGEDESYDEKNVDELLNSLQHDLDDLEFFSEAKS